MRKGNVIQKEIQSTFEVLYSVVIQLNYQTNHRTIVMFNGKNFIYSVPYGQWSCLSYV